MKRIGLYLAWIFILLMGLLPLYSLKEGLSVGKTPPEITRLHWQTNNTTRIWGDNWEDIQIQILTAKIQSITSIPRYITVVDPNSWQEVLTVCPLAASPINSLIILSDDGKLPQILQNYLSSPQANSTDLLLLGKTIQFEPAFKQHYKTKVIEPSDYTAIAQTIDTELTQTIGLSRDVILINGASDPKFALPVTTWATHRGTPILFFNGATLPDATKAALSLRKGNCNIYVIAPPGSTDRTLIAELATMGKVSEVGHPDLAEHSVAFARYFDDSSGFGWRTTKETADGGKQFLLVPSDEWRTGMIGAQLFSSGIFGPQLVTTDKTRLPLPLEKFYFESKPDWWVTPAEGPYNHTWILGNTDRVSYSEQGRAHFLQEISDYKSKGSQGMSGIEAITAVWYALAIVCALLAWAHLSTRMFQLSPFMRLAWVLAMLVLGPIGLWSYYTCYRGYGHQVAKGEFPRPLWVQVLAATCGTLGFGMPAMILVSFGMTYWGLPLLISHGSFFFVTGPMFQSVLWSYLAAILVNALLFVPLMLAFKETSTYWGTVKDNFGTVFWSMTSVSIGMMPAMWLIMMEYLQMMPREEDLLWWGSMYAASLVGLITGYIGNWPLVASTRKKGTM